jgi:hypothetical protein
VVDGREEDFAGVFKPGGIWQEFLQRSLGYLTSELVQFADRGRFEVFDYWQSHEEFEICRRERQPEIERFKLLFLDSLVQREMLLGSFYEDGPDESGLVLS